MKTQNIIRILAGLSFVIFFCPFFQTCADESILKHVKKEATEVETESGNDNVDSKIVYAETETVVKNTLEAEQNAKNGLDEKRKHYTLNGYELGYYDVFKSDGEFKLENLLDIQLAAFSSYTIIIILSVLIIAFSFRGKYKVILFLCVINILLAISSMVIFYFEEVLEDPPQIKFGYYLFIINSIAIIVFSKKAIKQYAI